MPGTPTLKRLRQEDHKLEASLNLYIWWDLVFRITKYIHNFSEKTYIIVYEISLLFVNGGSLRDTIFLEITVELHVGILILEFPVSMNATKYIAGEGLVALYTLALSYMKEQNSYCVINQYSSLYILWFIWVGKVVTL